MLQERITGLENLLSILTLKSDSGFPKKKIFIFFNDRPSKTMRNAFYFILKALFVLKIFKFLSSLFGNVKKRLD